MATILTPGYLRFDGYKYITVSDIDLGGGGGGGSGVIPSFVSDITTATNAPTTLASFTLTNKKSVTYVAVVTARNDSNSLSKSWVLQRRAVINTSSIVLGPLASLQDPEVFGGSDPGWSLTIDNVGSTLRVRGTGSSGATVHWNTYTEVYVSTSSDGGVVGPPPTDPPTVSSIYPDIGGNVSGMTVTITGTNFTGATVATVGGVPITSFALVNSTTITGVLPATSAGFLTVGVTTPIGTGTLSNAFASLEVSSSPFTLHHAGAGVTASAGDVMTVDDQGSIGLAARLTPNSGATTPTLNLSDVAYNNKATFSFPTASSNLKSSSYTINEVVTMFVVGQSAIQTTGYPYYLVDGRNDYMALYGNNSTSSEIYASGSLGFVADSSVKQVWTAVYNTTSSLASASSNTETTGSTGAATTPDGITIGSYHGNLYGCEGKVALVLQIQGALTLSQRNTNRAILGTYYGKTIA